MNRQLQALLLCSVEFEAGWDSQLAGFGTRPYRELMGYCAGRLLAAGAGADAVVQYLRELITEFNIAPDGSEAGTSS